MTNVNALDSLSDECFSEFVTVIHELTGITIAASRKAMVQSRFRKRVIQLSLTSYQQYLDYLKKNREEQGIFVDLITTNETYFFRTPRIWEYIEKRFLAEWHRTHPKQVFNAWSAASSSGEEAHSLAILCQAFKDKNPGFLFQVLGTDISKEMISLCHTGTYGGRAIEAFRTSRHDLFQKYMLPAGEKVFQAVPEIRARLRFQTHNLFNRLSGQGPFDLVLLRNVLIYFTAKDQQTVLSHIPYALRDDGLLIIGESESLSHIKTEFRHKEALIYGKADNAA